jgi:amino acid adenylation domain-containing protein
MNLSPTKRALLDNWRQGNARATPGHGRIPRRREAGAAPVSFAQQRLWFIDRLDGGRTPLNLAATFRLSGSLDRDRLHQCLNQIVGRHEALRTHFREIDGTPVQLVAPALTVSMPTIELSELAEADRASRVRQITSEELDHRFDLDTIPLFRVTLIRWSDSEHLLVLVRHHIVADDWSNALFVDELIAHYSALGDGRPADLPPLEIQYADYAAWQRESSSHEWSSQLAYWRQQLSGPVPSLDLSSKSATSDRRSFRGALVPFHVPEALDASLSALARSEGATAFMILLAAFQLLLARYSGSDDVWVACPIANRTHRAVENLIGVFANTVVIRADLSGNPTFRECLVRVRDASLAAYEHQGAPFEQVVEQLQSARDAAEAPLVRTMFVLQNAPSSARRLAELSVELAGVDTSASMFDVSLILRETGSGLRGVVEYSTELFDAGRMAALARHYVRLLESIAARPDERLDQLELLDGNERRDLLTASTGSAVDGRPCRLHELFERQAERRPDAVAVTCGGRSLTYGGLNQAADALALRLQRLGVGPEVPVGLCLARSVELGIAVLAVLKAGGAYVPLDPELPAERLQSLVRDTRARVIVTGAPFHEGLKGIGVHLVDVAAQPEANTSGDGLARTVAPDNLAYIIHTSGSTGRPKGVMVTHANVVASTLARSAFYREPVDAFLLLSPLTFDSSVAGLFWTWGSGGMLVIPSDEEAFHPASLGRLVERQSVSHLLAIPSLYSVLIEETPTSQLASLNTVILAGEACPSALVNQHHRFLPGTSLINEYGPTEATVWSTAARCGSGSGESVPIGAPIPGARAYVLDRSMNLLPDGVSGELYIGGAGISRGYLGHPDVTAERFVPDPFSGEAGSRLYRTGDRVRRRDDGALEFLGRVDRQVKIRGIRVEPGEIEHVLGSHPGVREVAVKAVDRDGGRIEAFVVPRGPTGPTASALEAFARAALPRAIVPATFVIVEAFPRLANGKVDHGALTVPADGGSARAETRRPASATESQLAAIWSELLQVGEPDLDSSFFELGGHSLSAARMLARVRNVCLVDLPLRAVFEDSSIGALAARIDAARRSTAAAAARPIVTQPRSNAGPTDFPLSFAQERLWFLDRLNPGSAAYNVPTACRLTGPLDRASLSRALQTIVARHESLRTSFAVCDGRPIQRIWPDAEVPIREIDLRGTEEASKREQLATELAEEATRPVDLSRVPLLRVALVQVDDDEHIILVTTHHIVSDAWSLNIFFRELARAERPRRPAGAVRRLFGVAAGAARAGRPAGATRVLAGAACRAPADDRPSRRSSAAADADYARQPVYVSRHPEGLGAFGGALGARASHALHVAPLGLRHVAVPLHRSGRDCGRFPGCRPPESGARGRDRLFRQHARASRQLLGESDVPRIVAAHESDVSRCRCASGRAFRKGRRKPADDA